MNSRVLSVARAGAAWSKCAGGAGGMIADAGAGDQREELTDEERHELKQYREYPRSRFTGPNSEWCGTRKPGWIRHFGTGAGFKAAFVYYSRKVRRGRTTTARPASRESPSVACITFNKIFRKGRGRQPTTIEGIRVPFIAIVCPPSSEFTPIKELDPTGRGFDCWALAHKPSPNLAVATVPDVAVFYVHGGGFIGGDWAGFRGFCEHLHHLFNGAPLYFPNYRIAPEVSIPDQVGDCLEAYKLFAGRTQAKRLIVVGDSCGGCLGMLLLQKLAREADDAGAPRQPDGAVFFSAVTDLSCSGASFDREGTAYIEDERSIDGECIGECTFDPEAVRLCFRMARYGGYPQVYSATDPRVSPLFGNCQGLPPVYMLTSGAEVFTDDSVRMCEQLAQAGVQCKLDVWKRLPGSVFHAWVIFHNLLPEANIALDCVHEWVLQLPVHIPIPKRGTRSVITAV